MQIENKQAGASAAEHKLRLPVTVTKEIINAAVPKQSGHCMISDAVSAAAKRMGWRIGKVLTDLQTIRFTDLDKKRRIICWTPRLGQLKLLEFDHGVKPTPFSFRLRAVQIIESKSRAKRSKTRQGNKPKLVVKKDGKGGYSHIVKQGGAAIPIAIGQRREFGLHSLGVWPKAKAAAVVA